MLTADNDVRSPDFVSLCDKWFGNWSPDKRSTMPLDLRRKIERLKYGKRGPGRPPKLVPSKTDEGASDVSPVSDTLS